MLDTNGVYLPAIPGESSRNLIEPAFFAVTEIGIFTELTTPVAIVAQLNPELLCRVMGSDDISEEKMQLPEILLPVRAFVWREHFTETGNSTCTGLLKESKYSRAPERETLNQVPAPNFEMIEKSFSTFPNNPTEFHSDSPSFDVSKVN